MPKLRDLPPAELEVMKVLWEKGPSTVKQIQAERAKTRALAYTTIATLLSRLREKGYVSAAEKNFAYVFTPTVPRDEVVQRKVDDLVTRILSGDLAPVATYIAEKRKLTPEQVKMLKEIVKAEEK
jgi:BlaI family transcriptional regulator, penicillinase repressor